MSSILDALNKLEQEKAQIEQEEEVERDIDPRQAARELVGGLPGQSRSVRLTPAALLVGAVAFMGVMIAVSVGVTVAILSRSGDTAPTQTAEVPVVAAQPEHAVPAAEIPSPAPVPEPEPEPAAVVALEPEPEPVEVAAPVVEEEPEVVEVQIAAVAPTPAHVEPVVEPAPVVVEEEPVAERVAPEPEPAPMIEAAPEPEPEPVMEPEAEPRSFATARREPVQEPAPAPVVTDIRKLPPLTRSVAQRYGSEPILINMISPASATRPYAYAIINRIKVTVGDYIGNSRLRLVDVENHGIAVDAAGDRYYVAF